MSKDVAAQYNCSRIEQQFDLIDQRVGNFKNPRPLPGRSE